MMARVFVGVAAVAVVMPIARAHSDHALSTARAVVKEQKAWGIAGDARVARRTVDVSMRDDMRFSPQQISVQRGETLRIRVRNEGKVMHEFVIGYPADNAAHAALMIQHPGMEHDEPYMVHVPPGKTGEIVWHFNRAGEFEFACLIAGHYQAGMTGKIRVTDRTVTGRPATDGNPK
ncbi:MAG: cupredoxin family protein [Burkholderiales bacterium]|nr:cupredoxin family protein [Burkholderiales bacterium]